MLILHWRKKKYKGFLEKIENENMSNLQSGKKAEFDIYKAENSCLYFT